MLDAHQEQNSHVRREAASLCAPDRKSPLQPGSDGVANHVSPTQKGPNACTSAHKPKSEPMLNSAGRHTHTHTHSSMSNLCLCVLELSHFRKIAPQKSFALTVAKPRRRCTHGRFGTTTRTFTCITNHSWRTYAVRLSVVEAREGRSCVLIKTCKGCLCLAKLYWCLCFLSPCFHFDLRPRFELHLRSPTMKFPDIVGQKLSGSGHSPCPHFVTFWGAFCGFNFCIFPTLLPRINSVPLFFLIPNG